MNRESIDSLARRLAASLPQGVRALRDDAEANFRAILKTSLARLDLVTREEFEVQQLVLERAREKLAALESRLAEIETQASRPARKTPARKKSPARKKKTRADKTADD